MITPLTEAHRLETFDCGDPARTSWLRTRALDSQTTDNARTYVAVDDDGKVWGYYALATATMLRAGLPGALRRNAPDPVSCLLLAQLGVDVSCQGRGLGRELVLHAMGQAVKVAALAGCRLFIVHPATAGLEGYYEKFGFIGVEATPGRVMAMSLQRVRATLAAV